MKRLWSSLIKMLPISVSIYHSFIQSYLLLDICVTMLALEFFISHTGPNAGWTIQYPIHSPIFCWTFHETKPPKYKRISQDFLVSMFPFLVFIHLLQRSVSFTKALWKQKRLWRMGLQPSLSRYPKSQELFNMPSPGIYLSTFYHGVFFRFSFQKLTVSINRLSVVFRNVVHLSFTFIGSHCKRK